MIHRERQLCVCMCVNMPKEVSFVYDSKGTEIE